jgi:amino acid permease
MTVRALDGSYSIEPSSTGKFIVDNLITPPSFEGSSMFGIDLRALVLVSNFGLAFIAHYNAPTYFREMKDATAEGFSKMVHTAYSVLALIYVAAMCAGYATFGDTARGNILLNYHPKDTLGESSCLLSVQIRYLYACFRLLTQNYFGTYIFNHNATITKLSSVV